MYGTRETLHFLLLLISSAGRLRNSGLDSGQLDSWTGHAIFLPSGCEWSTRTPANLLTCFLMRIAG